MILATVAVAAWLAVAGSESTLIPPVPESTWVGALEPESTLVVPPVVAAPELVAVPVLFDSVPVYIATGADSATAAAEAGKITQALQTLRARRARPGTVRLQERDGAGLVLVDSLVVLEVGAANRVDTTASPLANALRLREWVIAAPLVDERWMEEELLLRLLLGVVYPVSLLVLLRLTRFGVRRFERRWRRAALGWVHDMAARRGIPEAEAQGRRIIRFVTGLERLILFGLALVAVSFVWFALFPQTRPLAGTLLHYVMRPLLAILGGTARGVLLLAYSALVVTAGWWVSRHVAYRKRTQTGSVFGDPLVHLPVRIGIWVVVLFLLLFPYPGAPRQFAVGVLLLLLLATLIALRPIIEEIAAGIYVNSQYKLNLGSRFVLDGTPYVVVGTGLVHLQVDRDGTLHRVPYSRILKSDFSVTHHSGVEG